MLYLLRCRASGTDVDYVVISDKMSHIAFSLSAKAVTNGHKNDLANNPNNVFT